MTDLLTERLNKRIYTKRGILLHRNGFTEIKHLKMTQKAMHDLNWEHLDYIVFFMHDRDNSDVTILYKPIGMFKTTEFNEFNLTHLKLSFLMTHLLLRIVRKYLSTLLSFSDDMFLHQEMIQDVPDTFSILCV
jgi:hypothetical protein